MRLPVGTLRARFLSISIVLAAGSPLAARITKTNPAPSETFSAVTPLTIGGGVEYETNSEQSQWDFPLLIEYTFTEEFKLTIEPTFSVIDSGSPDVRSVGGLGDLETSVEYEFLKERRYRPGLTALAMIRWNTASDPDLGNPGTDYGIGLIASKDFVYVDVDFSATYFFSGDPAEGDTLELSLAAEYHLTPKIDLIAEIVTTIGKDVFTGRHLKFDEEPLGGNGIATEGTLGFAWHVNRFLKLEQGVVLRDDGTWQIGFAWEYSFSGED